MADKPTTDDEKTPATDEKDQIFHPNGMNPHAVPEKAPADEQADDGA
jgi:hypothetical protein